MSSLFIDGSWTAGSGGTEVDVVNPFDRSIVAKVEWATAADVDRAVTAAATAFAQGEWPGTPARERAALLDRTAELLLRDKEEIARTETLDTGKTLIESRVDVDDVVAVFRYYADLADKDAGRVVDTGNPTVLSRIVYEPVGVCALITPWNYPLLQISWKVAPALAAGNTVVIKPSEVTPLSTVHLVRLLQEAGAPRGVVNLVLGDGRNAGAPLVEHPGVDMVSFTGGLATGQAIMRAGATTVKKVAVELGGKNPNIVFADTDFETVVDNALTAVFLHAGQVCSAGARLIVEDALHDDLVAAVAERADRIRLGNDTEYGLAGAVWTNDGARAQRVAGALRHGTIWINDYHPYVPQAEWGGFKRSGNGRELGPTGLAEYREAKHIWHNTAPAPQGWFRG